MTTAARFGSTEAAFAHRTISFPQYWTSGVKMGESPLEDVELSIEKFQAGLYYLVGELILEIWRRENYCGSLG